MIKFILFIILYFATLSCSQNNLPNKEFDMCFSLTSNMLKDSNAKSKFEIVDSSGFHLRCFNYKYGDEIDYFSTSDKYIDIVEVLDIYKKNDLTYSKNWGLNNFIDSVFKVNFLFETSIDTFEVKAYDIKTDKTFISSIYIHEKYGIILVYSVYPNGSIDLKKFNEKRINFSSSTLIRLDSLLSEYFLKDIYNTFDAEDKN